MNEVNLEELSKQFSTKSALIRHLYERGKTIAEIAQLLGIRYQFAYNVIQRYHAGSSSQKNNGHFESNNKHSGHKLLSASSVLHGSPTREDAEAAVRTLIAWIGENPSRSSLVRTPYRVTSALEDLCDGYTFEPSEVLSRTFPAGETKQDMVLIRNITVHSMCEHHMLPFVGIAHVAYIPDQELVGLSKITRLVQVLSRRLQTQENLTRQIADNINEAMSPLGVAVYIDAEHDCMKLRGVKMKDVSTTTSCFIGQFQSNDDLINRFISQCGVK